MTRSPDHGAASRGSDWIARVRLVSGLVMFVFVTTHLLNHALGVFSLDWMERGRFLFNGLWSNDVGTTLLGAAFAAHLVLGARAVISLRTLRVPRWELAQKTSGLAIPLFVLPHLVTTSGWVERPGFETSYAYELAILWPGLAGVASLGLVLVWIHGCAGIHFWLRFRPGYSSAAPWLLGLAVAIPLLALAGFASGGHEATVRSTDPVWLAEQSATWPAREDMLSSMRTMFAEAVAVILGIVGIWFGRRFVVRAASVRVTYPNGLEVRLARGATVLDGSRSAGIPHASVCGGRGRCSTCRVRVDTGLESLPEPGARERVLLDLLDAPANVRLACQVHPKEDLQVTPLLPPHIEPREALAGTRYRHGRELEVAVLFSDLRGFTQMTEHQLPYDVVFVLNRYFHAMGETIREHHGHLVQVLGDGILALFAMEEGAPTACRQALRTARAMARRLDELNAELDDPLRMGMALHSGTVIVGEMGYRRATIVTAVGAPVNATSRLQDRTKQLGCELLVSGELAERAAVDLSAFYEHRVDVRGLSDALSVRAIPKTLELPELEPEPVTPAAPLPADA